MLPSQKMETDRSQFRRRQAMYAFQDCHEGTRRSATPRVFFRSSRPPGTGVGTATRYIQQCRAERSSSERTHRQSNRVRAHDAAVARLVAGIPRRTLADGAAGHIVARTRACRGGPTRRLARVGMGRGSTAAVVLGATRQRGLLCCATTHDGADDRVAWHPRAATGPAVLVHFRRSAGDSCGPGHRPGSVVVGDTV